MPTEFGGESAVAPAVGDLAGAFPQLEILELIGQGGMGFVYKARQPKLDRLVALKILPEVAGRDPSFAERFVHEGRLLARLNHPNILTLFDFGQSGQFCFLLMEYVDGVNLRQAMQAGAFTADQALAVVPKICEALQFAHGEGILHRDIKPENILLDKRGRIKIADFGIAKLLGDPSRSGLTASGASIGTPLYMAPEQIERPGVVDHRADIYSLGVVFYEMLTGELPLGRFAAPSERSKSDPRLDEVVLRALEKQPERRQQNASEIKTQVESIQSAPPTPRTQAILKSSPCYLSTPAHLRSVLGQIYIYTGSGELSLDMHALSFVESGVRTTIPLASIRELGVGQYPWVAKPTRLDYIHVTFEGTDGMRSLLFTPHAGRFRPTWQTNRVVAEWHGAILEMTKAATGLVLNPVSTESSEKKGPSLATQWAAFLMIPLGIGLAIGTACYFYLLAFGGSAASLKPFVRICLFGTSLALFLSFLGWGVVSWRKRVRRLSGVFFLLAFAELAAFFLISSLRRGAARLLPPDLARYQAQALSEPTPAFGLSTRTFQLRHLAPRDAVAGLAPLFLNGALPSAPTLGLPDPAGNPAAEIVQLSGAKVEAAGFNSISATGDPTQLARAASLLFVWDWPAKIPAQPDDVLSATRAFIERCVLLDPAKAESRESLRAMLAKPLQDALDSRNVPLDQIARAWANHPLTQLRAEPFEGLGQEDRPRAWVTCTAEDVPGLHQFSLVREPSTPSGAAPRWVIETLPPLLDPAFK